MMIVQQSNPIRYFGAPLAIRFLISLLILVTATALGAEGKPRIVLMNLTPELNSYRDKLAAENFTAAMQAQLSTEDDGVEWVERTEIAKAEEELNLQKFGFTDNAGAIRGGQWMKADVSVIGRFSHNDAGGRTLFLEFLDLDRADVLLDETFVLNAGTNGLLQNAFGEVSTVTTQFRSLLPKALEELKRARQQKKLTVLFLATRGVAEASMKQEFNEQLNAMTKTNSSLRLVRFPRPADSVSEAKLAYSGMLDSRFKIENITDYFVWGTCTTIPSANYDRTNKVWNRFTNYNVELNITDGKSQPVLLKKKIEKKLPDFIALLQEGVMEAARSKTPSTNDFSAVEISKMLTQRAKDESRLMQHKFVDSDEDVIEWNSFLNTIETACFLDPGNREAAEMRLRFRWGKQAKNLVKQEFRFQLEKSEAWGNFVQTFGLPPEPAPEFVWEYVHSILEPLESFKYSRYELAAAGVPMDAGNKLLDEWRAPMAEEFVKRVTATVQRGDLESRLLQILDGALNVPGGPIQPIKSHALRAKFIETMAPALKKLVAKTGKIDVSSDARADVVATFNTLGRPTVGVQLLKELGQELPDRDMLVFSPDEIKSAVDPDTADTPEKQLKAGRIFERDENYQQAAEMYLKAAESGNTKAQYALADLYNFGKLGDDQRSKAIAWYQKAAAQGHTQAMAELAQLSEFGKVPFDFNMLLNAAKADNLDAQWMLAHRYKKGNGVAQNDAEAFKWFMKAVEHDGSSRVTQAAYEIGLLYEAGRGVPKDIIKARQWFVAAAESNTDAMIKVGEMFETGDGMPQDFKRAAELYRSGTGMQKLLNLLLQHGTEIGDAKLRRKYFQDAVRSLEYSRATEARDYKRLAAPLPGDLEGCIRLFVKDSDSDPKRQFQVGQMYEQVLGGPSDLAEAAKWYEKAASEGLVEAQLRLGLFYRDGRGVEKNSAAAYKWISTAAAQGSSEAKKALVALKK